jgi:hypothetical protein
MIGSIYAWKGEPQPDETSGLHQRFDLMGGDELQRYCYSKSLPTHEFYAQTPLHAPDWDASSA